MPIACAPRRPRPTPRRRSWHLGLFASGLLAWGALLAQPGLYGPEAPAEAAWVRVVNVDLPGAVAVRLGGEEATLHPGDATRYLQLEPGGVRVEVAGSEVLLEVVRESFTTVVATRGGLLVVPDPALRDASRGLLGLLNLTASAELDLRAPDGTPVVAGVAPGAHAALPVARATTELLVTEGDEVLLRIEARSYERGVAYVIVVFDATDGVDAHLVSSAAD